MIAVTTVGQIPTPTLNFGITSHNEPGEDYSTNANYRPVRDTLQRIVDLISTKSAKYNMELSVNFVQGCLNHEVAASTSTDVIEYAYKMGGLPYGNVVEIDPRFKAPAPYSIADVSYSIALTGAQASNVVGGFVYYNNTSSTYTVGDWLTYTTTISGIQNTTYSWTPNIIWGAGSIPPHSKDLDNYGVWKPRGKADSVDFYCHNPSQTVWNQGNGCSWVLTPTTNVNMMISEIRTEATKIKNGTYPANKFYNASLMINFKDFKNASYPTFQMPVILSRVLDSMNVLAASGLIAWKTITQKQTAFSTWTVTTGIPFSQWKCGQTATLAPTCNLASVNELTDNDENFKVFPNPVTTELSYEFSSLENKNSYLFVYDNLGREVIKQLINEPFGKISVENLSLGLYLINVTGTRPKKLLITK